MRDHEKNFVPFTEIILEPDYSLHIQMICRLIWEGKLKKRRKLRGNKSNKEGKMEGRKEWQKRGRE